MQPNTQSAIVLNDDLIKVIVSNEKRTVSYKINLIHRNSPETDKSSNFLLMLKHAAVANNIELIAEVLRELGKLRKIARLDSRSEQRQNLPEKEKLSSALDRSPEKGKAQQALESLEETLKASIAQTSQQNSLDPLTRACLICMHAETFNNKDALKQGLSQFEQLTAEEQTAFIKYAINQEAFWIVANLATMERKNEPGTPLLNFDALPKDLQKPLLQGLATHNYRSALKSLIPNSEIGADRLRLFSQDQPLVIHVARHADKSDSSKTDVESSIKYLLDIMDEHKIPFNHPKHTYKNPYKEYTLERNTQTATALRDAFRSQEDESIGIFVIRSLFLIAYYGTRDELRTFLMHKNGYVIQGETDDNKDNALTFAWPNKETREYLLEEKLKPNMARIWALHADRITDEDLQTYPALKTNMQKGFYLAAKDGNFEQIDAMLKRDSSLANQVIDGHCALSIAIRNGHGTKANHERLNTLIENSNLDSIALALNQVSTDLAQTREQRDATRNHIFETKDLKSSIIDIISLSLEKGYQNSLNFLIHKVLTDTNLRTEKDENFHLILMMIAQTGDTRNCNWVNNAKLSPETVGMMLNQKDKTSQTTPLQAAILNQNWDAANAFIQQIQEANPPLAISDENREQYSQCLIQAAQYGQSGIVEFLLRNNLLTNMQNDVSDVLNDALVSAAKMPKKTSTQTQEILSNKNKTIDAILKYADENQITLSPESKNDALYWAVRSHNTEAAESLIKAEAPIHLTTILIAFLTFKFDIGILLFQARYPSGQKNEPNTQTPDDLKGTPENAKPNNDDTVSEKMVRSPSPHLQPDHEKAKSNDDVATAAHTTNLPHGAAQSLLISNGGQQANQTNKPF